MYRNLKLLDTHLKITSKIVIGTYSGHIATYNFMTQFARIARGALRNRHCHYIACDVVLSDPEGLES